MKQDKLALIAFGWTLAVVAFLVFGPSYGFSSGSTDGGFSSGYRSGLSVNGPKILVACLIPFSFALAALLIRQPIMRVIIGLLLFVVSAISFGPLLWPAVVLIILSAFIKPKPAPATT